MCELPYINFSEKQITSDMLKAIVTENLKFETKYSQNHKKSNQLEFNISKIRTEHVNAKKQFHITDFVKCYSDIFHLPSKRLSFTNNYNGRKNQITMSIQNLHTSKTN